jgi:hypothetical protein
LGLADTADLLVRLKLDDQASGTADKIKGGFGQLGTIAAGVAAGGFALMTKGALEMEDAQGKFQAATGKSAEEAKLFTQDMNDLVGTAFSTGQSFGEIAEVGTTVSQQFKTTGEDTRKLTEDILAFSTATGTDATTNAAQLEDTLSAFGLSANDAAGYMDKLVLSSQKYGTDAGPETLAVLQGMAPALQAMGEDMDAGIGLLNLFETAGLDAGAAQAGLKKAVDGLKPGENLDDLIARLGAIEDPTERAQAAIDIFGARSGIGLANAIKPGMTSLSDFEVSLQEAEGTSRDAASAMETTGDKIRNAFDKLGAGLREIGGQFGPLIAGMGSIGSLAAPLVGKLGGVTAALWAKVTALKAAEGGWKTLTPVIGGATVALGAFAAGVMIANEAGNELELQYTTATEKIKGLTDASPENIAALREMGQKALENADALKFMHFWDTEASIALRETGQAALDQANILESQSIPALDAMANRWMGYAQTVVPAIESATPEISEAARFSGIAATNSLAQAFDEGRRELESHYTEAVRFAGASAHTTAISDAIALGKAIPGQLGQSLADNSRAVLTGAETLRDILKNGLTPEQQAMEVIGKKYVNLLREGITSEIPGAKQTAQELAVQAIRTIADAGLTGAQGVQGLKAIGQHFDTLLASGMTANAAAAALAAGGVSVTTINAIKAKYPQFFQAGSGAANQVQQGFGSLNYNSMGASVAQEWFNGFKNKFDRFNFANVINSNISPYWSGQSPPKKGPLHHIDTWGEKVGEAWLGGFGEATERGVPRLINAEAIDGATRPGNRPILTTPIGGGVSRSPITIDVAPRIAITLSTRDVDDEINHYRYVQGMTR